MSLYIKIGALYLAALLVLCAGCSVQIPETVPDTADETFLPCPYYNAPLVHEQLTRAAALEGAGELLGATMPHYAPMMDMGADVLKAVSAVRTVETVVILAPNHEGTGAAVQLSGSGYRWPDGTLNGDPDAAALLLGQPNLRAYLSDDVIATDHAASIWAPYIANLMPDAKVVTVLLSRSARAEDLTALSGGIRALTRSREVFVLASVDFSHYQIPQVMEEHDRKTRETIARGDITALRLLDGAYLDCPEALGILMLLGDVREYAYDTVLYNENGRTLGGSFFVCGVGQNGNSSLSASASG